MQKIQAKYLNTFQSTGTAKALAISGTLDLDTQTDI